jgi:hypothetical protein
MVEDSQQPPKLPDGCAERCTADEAPFLRHPQRRFVGASHPAVEVATEYGVRIVVAKRLEQELQLPGATGAEAASDVLPGRARVQVEVDQPDSPGSGRARGAGDVGGDRDAAFALERKLDGREIRQRKRGQLPRSSGSSALRPLRIDGTENACRAVRRATSSIATRPSGLAAGRMLPAERDPGGGSAGTASPPRYTSWSRSTKCSTGTPRVSAPRRRSATRRSIEPPPTCVFQTTT